MNSTWKGPTVLFDPADTSSVWTFPCIPCSPSFPFTSPRVSRVPMTGACTSRNRYGNAPTWSSCPWVRMIPFSFCLFSITYVKSGRTRSIPSISSSGNISPASMSIIESPYSTTVIFLPIAPNPPRGTTLSLFKVMGSDNTSGCLQTSDLHDSLSGRRPRSYTLSETLEDVLQSNGESLEFRDSFRSQDYSGHKGLPGERVMANGQCLTQPATDHFLMSNQSR